MMLPHMRHLFSAWKCNACSVNYSCTQGLLLFSHKFAVYSAIEQHKTLQNVCLCDFVTKKLLLLQNLMHIFLYGITCRVGLSTTLIVIAVFLKQWKVYLKSMTSITLFCRWLQYPYRNWDHYVLKSVSNTTITQWRHSSWTEFNYLLVSLHSPHRFPYITYARIEENWFKSRGGGPLEEACRLRPLRTSPPNHKS